MNVRVNVLMLDDNIDTAVDRILDALDKLFAEYEEVIERKKYVCRGGGAIECDEIEFCFETIADLGEAGERIDECFSTNAKGVHLILLDDSWKTIGGAAHAGTELLRAKGDLIKEQSNPTSPIVVLFSAIASIESLATIFSRARVGVVSKQNVLHVANILLSAVDRAMLMQQQRELREIKEDLAHDVQISSIDLVATSSVMQECLATIGRYAPKTDFSIVLTGETGVGKKVLAEVIHQRSGVKGKFVTVDCSRLPSTDQLIIAYLFGHAKGAFTGAESERVGVFEDADGGTVYLDEFQALPMEVQGVLKRVIEEKKVRRVGENDERNVRFRLIVATNISPKQLLDEKRLQPDFYERLDKAIPIPALRERKDDVLELAQIFLRTQSRTDVTFSNSAEAALLSYSWPGNVRELRKAIRHALVELDDDESIITDQHLTELQEPEEGGQEITGPLTIGEKLLLLKLRPRREGEPQAIVFRLLEKSFGQYVACESLQNAVVNARQKDFPMKNVRQTISKLRDRIRNKGFEIHDNTDKNAYRLIVS